PGDRPLYHQQQRGGEAFANSIATLAPRVAGLADLAWTKIAGALLGPGTVVEPMRRHGSLQIADARTRQGEAMKICVGTASGNPAHVVELAVGIDDHTHIRGILPLTLGGYAR